MTLPVRVRGELEINVHELTDDAMKLIKSALTFPNEERENQAREQVPGWWSLPETISLWRIEERRNGTFLCLPRGFARQLVKGMNAIGQAIAWDDQRVKVEAASGYYRMFELRDYQFEAALAMAKANQGFYKCPAGGGKTVTMLGLAAFLNQRTLVIVDKADLVEQWRERAADPRFLGLDLDLDAPRSVGSIAQGVWQERDFTVALRQALWARKAEVDALQFWKQWGLTIFDEGHHLAGDTLGELAREVESAWMLGTSATPAKSETRGKVVHALVGPIIHETSRPLLREKGILMTPRVERIHTTFETHFHITHNVSAFEDCKVPKCTKQGKNHMHRNNYSSVVSKLTKDADRNALIAKTICENRGHHNLVYSRQLKHLDLMATAVRAEGWDGPIFFLRGEENARKESRDIVRQIESSGESVVFSTVADEALDIPILDRLHLPFPMRQAALVEQVCGRVERASEGKEDAVIYDYADPVKCFEGQADERDRHYRMMEYPITVRSPA